MFDARSDIRVRELARQYLEAEATEKRESFAPPAPAMPPPPSGVIGWVQGKLGTAAKPSDAQPGGGLPPAAEAGATAPQAVMPDEGWRRVSMKIYAGGALGRIAGLAEQRPAEPATAAAPLDNGKPATVQV